MCTLVLRVIYNIKSLYQKSGQKCLLIPLAFTSLSEQTNKIVPICWCLTQGTPKYKHCHCHGGLCFKWFFRIFFLLSKFFNNQTGFLFCHSFNSEQKNLQRNGQCNIFQNMFFYFVKQGIVNTKTFWSLGLPCLFLQCFCKTFQRVLS